MGEPIEQGSGQPFRAKNLSPFLERQVRCHHRCTAFVSLAEHLEEQLGAGLGQRHEAQLIDDEQFVAGDLLLEAKQLLVVTFRRREFLAAPLQGCRGEIQWPPSWLGKPVVAGRHGRR
jgi:hypothetical protein